MGRRFSHEAIAEALRENDGVQYYASLDLGCSQATVSIRVKESEELQEIVESYYGKLDGKAKKVLLTALDSEDERLRTDTAKWVEARVNKARFSERQEITGADGVAFNVSLGVLDAGDD